MSAMRFDPWGLGYLAHGASLTVHYPARQPDGSMAYGAGFPFDHAPELRRNPSSERATLWRDMLSPVGSSSSQPGEPAK